MQNSWLQNLTHMLNTNSNTWKNRNIVIINVYRLPDSITEKLSAQAWMNSEQNEQKSEIQCQISYL